MPDSQKFPAEAIDYLARYPDTIAVDALYTDLCGHIRGKRYPASMLGKVMTDGLATPGSVFLLDAMGESHDPLGLGFSDGDPDSILKAVPGSLVPVPWLADPTAQVLVTFVNADGSPYALEPRNVLAKVVRRLTDLKLKPVVAFELEFYLLDKERKADGGPQPPISPVNGKRMAGTQVYRMSELDAFSGLIKEITDSCATQGIKTGAITTEYAPGQFEINLHHLDDPLIAADQCGLFKRVVRAVALKHGVEATFMAKPYPDCAGSGLHMHCSLVDENGNNVFTEDQEGELNPTLLHAMGGVLELFGDSMGILAPNLNSYRRFKPNIFVPISPCWAMENRSVALRVPVGDKAARRIEHRIAGADANPYLALATLLAGIVHGLTKKVDPGPPTEGNAGQAFDPEIPFRPRRAFERLRNSKVLADYLGGHYLEVYAACKDAELDRFESVISPAEYDWYLQAE